MQEGKIKCKSDYKFRLLDSNGNVITTETVLINLSGRDIDQSD